MSHWPPQAPVSVLYFSVGCRQIQDLEIPCVEVDPCGDAQAAAEGAVLGLHEYNELKQKKKPVATPQLHGRWWQRKACLFINLFVCLFRKLHACAWEKQNWKNRTSHSTLLNSYSFEFPEVFYISNIFIVFVPCVLMPYSEVKGLAIMQEEKPEFFWFLNGHHLLRTESRTRAFGFRAIDLGCSVSDILSCRGKVFPVWTFTGTSSSWQRI